MTSRFLSSSQSQLRNEIAEYAQMLGYDPAVIEPVGDGVADVEGYLRAPLKVMWILKEPWDDFDSAGMPTGGGWNFFEDDEARLMESVRHGRSFHKQITEKFGAMALMLIPVGDSVIDASVTAENTKRTLESLLDSPDMTEVVSGFLPEVEKMIRGKGVSEIAGKVRIAERIATAVREMDVEEFHGVVDHVAAQHLGAIQVLGYFLGAIAGATLLLF